MPYEIERIDVWMGEIEDRPGGLSERLAKLADSGVDLRYGFARRTEQGKGVFFADPVGAQQARVMRQAGLEKSKDLQALRVSGTNKIGVTAKITRALADQGINLRGLAGAAIGNRCVFYILFDSKDDAKKAEKTLGAAKL